MNKNKSHLKLWLFGFTALITIAGCRTPREAERAPSVEVSKSYAEMLMKNVVDNNFDFEWLGTRFSGSASLDGKSYPLAGTLRMRKDSAIYISVTPIMGQEVARLLVTADSVKFLNRLESNYYVGGTEFFTRMFNASLDFDILQALFTGNDFRNASNNTATYKKSKDEIEISHSARNLGGKNSRFVFQQQLWVHKDNYRILRNHITETATGRTLRASYSEHNQVSGKLLPHQIDIQFSDKGTQGQVSMKYSRLTVNVPQIMEFSIPRRFEKMDLR